MKTLSRILLLTAGIILLTSGCGGGESEQDPVSDPVSGDTEVDPSTGDETPDTPIEEPEPEPQPLYPEGTLDPSLMDPGTPVTAKALYDAFYAWNGREVTLTGYCYIPYMRDTITVQEELEMISDIDSSDRLATIEFAQPLGILINKDQLITVRGTVEYYWTGDLVIVNAEVLPEALTPEAGTEFSPWAYDGSTPLALEDFAEAFSVWIGMEVTVDGYYHSTTTSTTDYGVTIRVDLGDPDDLYAKYVGCEMISEPPETLVDDRYGVQIMGTIVGESFDMVALEGCELVNR